VARVGYARKLSMMSELFKRVKKSIALYSAAHTDTLYVGFMVRVGRLGLS